MTAETIPTQCPTCSAELVREPINNASHPDYGRDLLVCFTHGSAACVARAVVAPLNEAEVLGRVTGSVAATYTVERRNADGTLTVESAETWTRTPAERVETPKGSGTVVSRARTRVMVRLDGAGVRPFRPRDCTPEAGV